MFQSNRAPKTNVDLSLIHLQTFPPPSDNVTFSDTWYLSNSVSSDPSGSFASADTFLLAPFGPLNVILFFFLYPITIPSFSHARFQTSSKRSTKQSRVKHKWNHIIKWLRKTSANTESPMTWRVGKLWDVGKYIAVQFLAEHKIDKSWEIQYTKIH